MTASGCAVVIKNTQYGKVTFGPEPMVANYHAVTTLTLYVLPSYDADWHGTIIEWLGDIIDSGFRQDLHEHNVGSCMHKLYVVCAKLWHGTEAFSGTTIGGLKPIRMSSYILSFLHRAPGMESTSMDDKYMCTPDRLYVSCAVYDTIWEALAEQKRHITNTTNHGPTLYPARIGKVVAFEYTHAYSTDFGSIDTSESIDITDVRREIEEVLT